MLSTYEGPFNSDDHRGSAWLSYSHIIQTTQEYFRFFFFFRSHSLSHFVVSESLFKDLAARSHNKVVEVTHFPQKTPILSQKGISVRGSLEEVVYSFTFVQTANFGFCNLLRFSWFANYEFYRAVFEDQNGQKKRLIWP